MGWQRTSLAAASLLNIKLDSQASVGTGEIISGENQEKAPIPTQVVDRRVKW